MKAKGVKRGGGRSMLSFSAHHVVVGLWQAVAPEVLTKQHSHFGILTCLVLRELSCVYSLHKS